MQAACMPYHGSATLYDFLHDLRATRGLSGDPAPKPRKTWDGPWARVFELRGRAYVAAILDLFEGLADGLAHAHARGIIHCDIKPANILLGDDGLPRLLDFSLSEEASTAFEARVGGTLPYMSPEALNILNGGESLVDARADLYAIGIVLYESLCLAWPFPVPEGSAEDVVHDMVYDRAFGPPDPRRAEPAITPAVVAIVNRCLTPTVEGRYQTAEELREDLRRQRMHLPLRHAVEPFGRERVAKWLHRHGRTAALGTVATLGTAVAAFAWFQHQRLERGRAFATFAAFKGGVQASHLDLVEWDTTWSDPATLRADLDATERALARLGRFNGLTWVESSLTSHLSPDDRHALAYDAHLFLLARARAETLLAPPDDPAAQQRAKRWRQQALNLESPFAEVAPRATLLYQTELARQEGRLGDADRLEAQYHATPPKSQIDRMVEARAHQNLGRHREAVRLLAAVTADAPDIFRVWLWQGVGLHRLERHVEAVGCFNAAVALDPESFDAWFYRGISHLLMEENEPNPERKREIAALARRDFNQALALRPNNIHSLVNRALAEEHLAEYPQALADLNRALELAPKPGTLVRVMRSRIHTQLKQVDDAARDLADARRLEPTQADDWDMRAWLKLEDDPEGALADLRRALELEPDHRSALENLAHVLSDRLHREAEAVPVMDRLVTNHPDLSRVWSGRAILEARLGRRAEASADAREALAREPDPWTRLQAAGVFALNSRQAAEDRPEALRQLALAVAQDGSLAGLAKDDPDLAPLRDDPEFRRLVGTAPVR
jgi:tetratricopeptide (TPR) repeat protein